MSVEIDLLIALAERIDPVQQFIKIADALSHHEKYGELVSLVVYEKELRTEVLSLSYADLRNYSDPISQILEPY